MWGAKTGAEGGALVTACEGLVGLLHRLGVAIDGGKDSLSMAARVGADTVLAPGESRAVFGVGGAVGVARGPPPTTATTVTEEPGGVTSRRVGRGGTVVMMGDGRRCDGSHGCHYHDDGCPSTRTHHHDHGCPSSGTHGCHHHSDGLWAPKKWDPWVPPP